LEELPAEVRNYILQLVLENHQLIQVVQASHEEKRINEELRNKITELSAKIIDQSLLFQQTMS
jgi:hypothetical protein